MDLSFDNDTSRKARFKRELRNPSLLTVILIFLAILLVVLGPFAPGWVSTTRSSFDAIAKTKERNESNMKSLDVIVPAQIAPWMASQVDTMIEAEGPLDWQVVSFRTGPCDEENLSQLPASKYSTSIATACGEIDGIQQLYSGKCFLASDCNVPEQAKEELRLAMGNVWEAFSDAGFVSTYEVIEQVAP
ncbi:MAG: hypothetical protein HOE43_10535 [Chloroflexi bacterium]|jgi:hypothetical protein|nr:hypothetical protein [Chloroflexota bacterium]